MREVKLENIIKELSRVNKKREEELGEMDRIAKMLIRRDLALNELKEKREKELEELKESKIALMDMLKDVHEARRKTEQERDKTLAIFNNFTDGLLLFNKDNILDSVNPQAEKFLKVKRENVVGKSILDFYKTGELESLINLLGEEIKIISKQELETEKNLFLEVSSTSVVGEREKWGTLVVLHNISREKIIERTKTEFVSIAAHQLRTPLSAVKWTLKMFLDGDLGSLTDDQKDYLKKAYKTNEAMINLINDLLNVARIEEGRYLYNPTLVDIADIIHFAIDFCKDGIKRKNINLVFDKTQDKPLKALVDTEKMKLAIQNLLDNAIKYTPAGGTVIIGLKYVSNKIEVSIKDSGIGISKDQQNRIFTKFFRSADAVRLETEGSGLGLFIVKNIIEAHDGKIWFESKEGKGTTFYFILPVKTKIEEFLMNLW